jgi:uncharacterized protein (TIGR04255 family)
MLPAIRRPMIAASGEPIKPNVPLQKTASSLPVKYERPPVVETILGIQFEPLPKLLNAHLGLFWQDLRGDWPNVREASPLQPQHEQFGDAETWSLPAIGFRAVESVASRMIVTNGASDRLIQIQNGRIHLNWLGQSGAEYPTFPRMFNEFREVVELLQRFLADRELGALRPNQWEVTYLNHIPRGTVWESPSDWRFFELLGRTAGVPELTDFESFGGEWHFTMQRVLGRLHIQWQHGKSREAPKELVILTLTARGPAMPDDSGLPLAAAYEGLGAGHDAIVLSFRDLMSDRANEFWGLQA